MSSSNSNRIIGDLSQAPDGAFPSSGAHNDDDLSNSRNSSGSAQNVVSFVSSMRWASPHHSIAAPPGVRNQNSSQREQQSQQQQSLVQPVASAQQLDAIVREAVRVARLEDQLQCEREKNAALKSIMGVKEQRANADIEALEKRVKDLNRIQVFAVLYCLLCAGLLWALSKPLNR